MDGHQFREEENGSVGGLSTVCSQNVLKCLFLTRIGRLDILWSVNKLARAVTKWTTACDKRLARLISYIHHTCCVGNTAQYCRLGFFQDSDLCKRHGRLEVDNRRNSEHFRKSHVRTNKLMCKKQSSVSHSSTEAEVISLDAGLHGWDSRSRSFGFSD